MVYLAKFPLKEWSLKIHNGSHGLVVLWHDGLKSCRRGAQRGGIGVSQELADSVGELDVEGSLGQVVDLPQEQEELRVQVDVEHLRPELRFLIIVLCSLQKENKYTMF